MQHLRNTHSIARLVLVWFALTIGAAIASPFVTPQNTHQICAASGGTKVLLAHDDDSSPAVNHTLHCPLCAGIGAPPPTVLAITFDPVQALSYVLQSSGSTHVTSATAAPPPARGPPTVL
jgi:hypothetical protein